MDNQKITHQNTTQKQGELKRDMKMRHLLMIAFGGAIGTGLFVGTGGNIASAGYFRNLDRLLFWRACGLLHHALFRRVGERLSHYGKLWGLCG